MLRVVFDFQKGINVNIVGLGSIEILIFNLAVAIAWPGFALLALLALRGRGLAGTALALWVLIIVAVPVLGPLAYFILRPGESQTPHQV